MVRETVRRYFRRLLVAETRKAPHAVDVLPLGVPAAADGQFVDVRHQSLPRLLAVVVVVLPFAVLARVRTQS